MIDYRRLAIALAASIIVATAITATAALDHHAYLPFVRGAAVRLTGPIAPPPGIICQLQTGSSLALDPRTDQFVFSCEAKNGHGFVAWNEQRVLLLDHLAAGSGSLSVVDGSVYAIAVRDDSAGSVMIAEVPVK